MGNISGSDELVTKQDLKDFYQAILPYLGGGSGSSGGETTYTAGTGIDITNGVISATGGGGTTYTAGDGIVIQNDEISTDNMPAADMAEIITPLPSVMSRLPMYSTEEQIVGYWIDGKPLYQRVFTGTRNTTETKVSYDTNIDLIFPVFGFLLQNGGNIVPLGYYYGSNNKMQIYIDRNNHEIVLADTVISALTGTYYLIMAYTKTTD